MNKNFSLLLLCLWLALPLAASAKKAKPAEPEKKTEEATYNYIVLRALNKVTAHAETIEMPVGTVAHFGTLEIVALSCWSAPPEEQPEDALLLDVRELKPDETPERIFVGWIFSSSPSLSSMEHPVYDITAVKCHKQGLKENEPAKP